MAMVIKTNGSEESVTPQNNKNFTLEELRELTDSEYVEIIYLTNGIIAVVDEDGNITGRLFNRRATMLCGFQVVGDVLFCNQSEVE